jgi:hypothetical protein
MMIESSVAGLFEGLDEIYQDETMAKVLKMF